MATITFTNAKVFIGGGALSAAFNQVAIDWSVESLDETTFGATSRKHKGGLDDARITGRGFWEGGAGAAADFNTPDAYLFDDVALDDTVVALFPDGITEGSTSTGAGYAFKPVVTRFNVGDRVGTLLPFDFEAQGRGLK